MTAHVLYPNICEDNLISWDSGNGSFQITIKEGNEYKIYQGPLGYGTVRVLLSRDIRKGLVLKSHESGNPVSKDEAWELTKKIRELLPPIPNWLSEKLKSEKAIVGSFGDGESIFAVVATASARMKGIEGPIEEAFISQIDVQKVIEQYLSAGDEIMDRAQIHRKTLTSALFLLAVMEHFEIKKVFYERANGNTSGILIHPSLWMIKE